MADTDILGLTTAGTLTGDEWLHIVQGGNSRKVQLSTIKTFINTDPTVVPSSVPFRGAQVYRTSDLSISSGTVISWQASDFDTDSLWSIGSPTRLTVPSGVTRIRLYGNIELTDSSSNVNIAVMKNGAFFRGGARQSDGGNTTSAWLATVTPVLSVTPGDYFELRVFPGTSADVVASTSLFAMEIVEASV